MGQVYGGVQLDTTAEVIEVKKKSSEAGLEYRKANREIRKKMKAVKEERTEEQCNIIQRRE